MRIAGLFVVLALGGCVSEVTPYPVWGAPNRDDVPAGDMSFDCDAPAGFRSEWSQKIDSSGHVRGAVFMTSVRKDDTYPSATVSVLSTDGSSAVLHVNYWRSSGKLMPSIRSYDSQRERKTVTLQPRSPRGIAFELAWQPTVVRIRLDSNALWLDVPISAPPDRLILGCSTGNSVFYSVTIAPPASPPASAPQPQASDAEPPAQTMQP